MRWPETSDCQDSGRFLARHSGPRLLWQMLYQVPDGLRYRLTISRFYGESRNSGRHVGSSLSVHNDVVGEVRVLNFDQKRRLIPVVVAMHERCDFVNVV